MARSNILVACYSRTGTTRALAEDIARACDAELSPIVDTVDRRGAWGYVRSIVDAARKKASSIAPFPVDVADYGVVAVGTPDWGKSVAAPVRAFLEANRGRFKRIAFFLTDAAGDHAQVFADMAALAGASPIATLGVPHGDVVAHTAGERAASFARALAAAATREEVSAPEAAAHP